MSKRLCQHKNPTGCVTIAPTPWTAASSFSSSLYKQALNLPIKHTSWGNNTAQCSDISQSILAMRTNKRWAFCIMNTSPLGNSWSFRPVQTLNGQNNCWSFSFLITITSPNTRFSYRNLKTSNKLKLHYYLP